MLLRALILILTVTLSDEIDTTLEAYSEIFPVCSHIKLPIGVCDRIRMHVGR